MKIKYFYVPKDMIVESTKSNESIVIVENTHNETIYMVSLKYNLPSGFSISQKEIEELQSNQKKSIKFNLTANTNKGVYNITIWAESIDDISGNKIQSPKYTFQVSVLEKTGVNTTIATTTYSIITTTTYSTTANTTTVATQSTTTNVQIKRLTNNVKFVLIGAIILILVVLLIIMSR
jgi:hypothetical protein